MLTHEEQNIVAYTQKPINLIDSCFMADVHFTKSITQKSAQHENTELTIWPKKGRRNKKIYKMKMSIQSHRKLFQQLIWGI